VRRRVRFGVRSETETTSYSVVQVPQADKRFGSGPVLSDYVVTTELVRSQVRPSHKSLLIAPFGHKVAVADDHRRRPCEIHARLGFWRNTDDWLEVTFDSRGGLRSKPRASGELQLLSLWIE
jgi:hypothetical protein